MTERITLLMVSIAATLLVPASATFAMYPMSDADLRLDAAIV